MINVEKLDSTKIDEVTQWPIWNKEPCSFDYNQEKTESFYVVEGNATLSTQDGNSVNISSGDLVTVQNGQLVSWEIHQAIQKHFKFFD